MKTRARKEEIAAYLKAVGAAVAQARGLAQLNQVQLAQRAGISRRTLIEVEAGRGGNLATLAAICIALQVAPESLGLVYGPLA